ncbi:hypothetical protein [Ferruginibacter sp.]
MKTILNALIFSIIALQSCSTVKEIPVKGTYPETPMVFSSSQSFDKVWDNLVDLFAQKGFSIKIIDRSSGLIISQRSLLSATMEDKNGKPVDPSAIIVVPSIKANGRIVPVTGTNVGPYATEKQIRALPVYGDWNVRVKSTATGSTINVNITNVIYENNLSGARILTPISISGYKSTGVFEKELSEIIK